MLLRTLFAKVQAPSVQASLAGLRAKFRNERERERFSTAFTKALYEMSRDCEYRDREYRVTSMFDNPEVASKAVAILGRAGVPEDSIAMLGPASEYLEEKYQPARGYSPIDIAGTITGAGVAGAMLGVGLLMIPGLGPLSSQAQRQFPHSPSRSGKQCHRHNPGRYRKDAQPSRRRRSFSNFLRKRDKARKDFRIRQHRL